MNSTQAERQALTAAGYLPCHRSANSASRASAAWTLGAV